MDALEKLEQDHKNIDNQFTLTMYVVMAMFVFFICFVGYMIGRPDERSAYIKCNSEEILKEGQYRVNFNMPNTSDLEIYMPDGEKVVVKNCSARILGE